jgi:hypothetical protein
MDQLIHYTHQKEDYDHLLAKSIYPFASVNMRNLARMGQKCNRTHKKAKDLIWDATKQIKAVNPYINSMNISLDFSGIILPSGGKSNGGKWVLSITPIKDETKHWNLVFNITDRIVKDYLTNGQQPDFDVWLSDFVNINRGKKELQSITA